MNNILKCSITIAIAAALTGCCNSNEKACFSIERVTAVPNFESGYELGVSACYAAATDRYLFVAGGCNFPNIPAADGGKKVYYKGIYRYDTESGEWEKGGELPMPSAYGVSLQEDDYWYIAGGMNSDSSLNNVYRIEIPSLETRALPELPCCIDNAAGAIAGNIIYIAGGNAEGKASNRVFSLDLNEKSPAWQELPPMPEKPRVQPVCAVANGSLYIWGGFAPANEKYAAAVHCDGLRYDIANSRWESIGEIKAGTGTITLSGGIATATDNHTIVAAGGVDKEIFLDAISGSYTFVEKEEYMHKPAEWYKFNNKLMMYDTRRESWQPVDSDELYARAGAQFARNGEKLFWVGGELKPGIRTPDICVITVTD